MLQGNFTALSSAEPECRRKSVLHSGRRPVTFALTQSVTSLGSVSPGVTRGGNWGCHPYFFGKKTDDLFSHHRPSVCLSVLQCHLFFSWKTGDLILLITVTFIDFTRGCHPVEAVEGVTPHLFHLSDLVCPLFFVNSPTFFSFGCHPLEGVTWGGPPPPPVTPLDPMISIYEINL